MAFFFLCSVLKKNKNLILISTFLFNFENRHVLVNHPVLPGATGWSMETAGKQRERLIKKTVG